LELSELLQLVVTSCILRDEGLEEVKRRETAEIEGNSPRVLFMH
jgi:hypothetical protein